MRRRTQERGVGQGEREWSLNQLLFVENTVPLAESAGEFLYSKRQFGRGCEKIELRVNMDKKQNHGGGEGRACALGGSRGKWVVVSFKYLGICTSEDESL